MLSGCLLATLRLLRCDGSMAGDVASTLGFAVADSVLDARGRVEALALGYACGCGWPMSELLHKEIAGVFNLPSILAGGDRVLPVNGGLNACLACCYVHPACWHPRRQEHERRNCVLGADARGLQARKHELRPSWSRQDPRHRDHGAVRDKERPPGHGRHHHRRFSGPPLASPLPSSPLPLLDTYPTSW